ncbi:MAG TPA: TetR/AcrR family transcriptional regulator [Anaerolineales bacterium]|nr:TetR/AcrR family transcriptional regulator [Anaerolineales bacterium]
MPTVREKILDTTGNLLEKQGYHSTGLNEIVRQSGAPKGSLYHYFPQGKEQLAAESVVESGHVTSERIRAGLSGGSPAAKAIHDFVLTIAENVERSGFAAGGPLTAVAVETATNSERINLACREAYWMLQAAFMEKLLEGGLTKAKARELATFITASIEGGIILSRTYHTADPLRLVAKQLLILLSSKENTTQLSQAKR